ncbi:peptidylprolyl isomerase [Pseudomethylobacillus aquaticus]|uniref:Periplasmic chaperone PpiD n=1 Tax=Pseudomethylobacillus aquaticus TaxID=2676064 RepID=A0A3N0V7C6_9PROT|nr:SurA N-terminal domain-containing protein [Pseudomethylobacillus aquaticus]ROH88288.1 peptidylprolyl isomerase [Pseudomethylobacillus aquaticus]
MLEAIREHTKGWLAKAILAAITIPFALFGIDSYLTGAGSGVAVAEVGKQTVTAQEYSNAMQNLRSQMQAEGQQVDQAMLDDPATKQAVLDRLINSKLLSAEISKAGFYMSDEALSQYISGMPEFQRDEKFSQEIYDSILRQNGLTPSRFEQGMRNDLLVGQARDGIAALAFIPTTLAQQTLKTVYQQRDVSVTEINAADFLPQVKVTAEDVQKYYDEHKDRFRVPEQVKLEFTMLSANTLIASMKVTDDEMRRFFDENAAKFQGDEQRRASHILIGFGVSASEADKKKAREQAEDVLAQVKANPAKFEELAVKFSQDPGSAEKGGDLGLFSRGTMVKAFDEAVFTMKPGAISDLVESEFGFHIIKLTEISGQSQSYDDVKLNIRAELLYQKALAKFAEQAENFSNMVYEQSSSLQPAAEAFGLQIQSSDWLTRNDGSKFFKSEKLMQQVFSDDVLKDKRNTEAIEIGPNTLVSARVLEYKPAAARSFEEVKAGIEEFLKLEQAKKLAKEKGEAILADLKNGKAHDELEWIPPVTITRKEAQGLSDLAMSHLFKLDASKLPAYGGAVDGNKGYLLMQVQSVTSELGDDATENKTAELELQAALSAEYVAAYVSSLRKKTDVKINTKLLDPVQP